MVEALTIVMFNSAFLSFLQEPEMAFYNGVIPNGRVDSSIKM
jgi:hypothetical protein